MEFLTSPEGWIALATLTGLEIILGIDNIIFISILSSKLPAQDEPRARLIGLALAMISRILLLLSLTLMMRLTTPLFSIFEAEISGRDIILIAGGLFLLAKSTFEIHGKLEGVDHTDNVSLQKKAFVNVLIQIVLLDIVFSFDSVITAVGMTDHLAVMIIAVVIAVIVMMAFSGVISRFVTQHPTIQMLALSFLLLIGLSLISEGLDFHIPKGYIYFAMFFSIFVEMLNLKLRKRATPVQLRKPAPE